MNRKIIINHPEKKGINMVYWVFINKQLVYNTLIWYHLTRNTIVNGHCKMKSEKICSAISLSGQWISGLTEHFCHQPRRLSSALKSISAWLSDPPPPPLSTGRHNYHRIYLSLGIFLLILYILISIHTHAHTHKHIECMLNACMYALLCACQCVFASFLKFLFNSSRNIQLVAKGGGREAVIKSCRPPHSCARSRSEVSAASRALQWHLPVNLSFHLHW